MNGGWICIYIYICLPRVHDINPSGLWLWDRTLKPCLLSRSMTVMASCLVSLQPAFLYTSLSSGGTVPHSRARLVSEEDTTTRCFMALVTEDGVRWRVHTFDIPSEEHTTLYPNLSRMLRIYKVGGIVKKCIGKYFPRAKEFVPGHDKIRDAEEFARVARELSYKLRKCYARLTVRNRK